MIMAGSWLDLSFLSFLVLEPRESSSRQIGYFKERLNSLVSDGAILQAVAFNILAEVSQESSLQML